MKKIILSLVVSLLLCAVTFAQITTLTFTGKNDLNQYVCLDRVVITNLTQSWQETIYYPDTILIMGATDIEDYEQMVPFSVSQNVPNPFPGISDFSLQLQKEQTVSIGVFDMSGKKITETYQKLAQGVHTFRVFLSTPQTYLLHVTAGTEKAALTVINTENAGGNRIDYVKSELLSIPYTSNTNKGGTQNPFSFGDEMEYVGYATIGGVEVESERIRQTQGSSQSFQLIFHTSSEDGQPCSGTPTLTDIDGNIYNTVRIGNQCWMRESLRTTKYADGTTIPMGTSTSTVVGYRYNPDNSASNVPTYGYLYNWKAVMGSASSSSSNPSKVQGACPTGWHVPSHAEWTQLTDYLSSQSQYVCGNDSTYIAKSLASTIGWYSSSGTCFVGDNPSANNATGFTAYPAGSCLSNYYAFTQRALFWSTTQFDESLARYRGVNYLYPNIGPDSYVNKGYGFSLRCLRN